MSHVRFVDLVAHVPTPLPLLLAHALTRNPGRISNIRIDAWLENTKVESSDVEALAELVGHAVADMRDEQTESRDSILMHALETLRPDAASAIHSLKPDEHRAGPYSPYEHGPTHQMFWAIDEHFMFLEVHNES